MKIFLIYPDYFDTNFYANLFEQANAKPRYTGAHIANAERAVVYFISDMGIPHDRTRHQLMIQADEHEKIWKRSLGFHLSPVNINRVAQRLEGIK